MLQFVGDQLFVDRPSKVDVKDVGKPYQVEQHVRYLFTESRMHRLLRSDVERIVGAYPLQEFSQFPDFSDKGKDQRLRVMEFLPVPLGRELAHGIAHRLSTIRDADSIVVMENGSIA